MIVKHVTSCDSIEFEEEVQNALNKELNDLGCNRKLIDIKYSTTYENDKCPVFKVFYSALLIFN